MCQQSVNSTNACCSECVDLTNEADNFLLSGCRFVLNASKNVPNTITWTIVLAKHQINQHQCKSSSNANKQCLAFTDFKFSPLTSLAACLLVSVEPNPTEKDFSPPLLLKVSFWFITTWVFFVYFWQWYLSVVIISVVEVWEVWQVKKHEQSDNQAVNNPSC